MLCHSSRGLCLAFAHSEGRPGRDECGRVHGFIQTTVNVLAQPKKAEVYVSDLQLGICEEYLSLNRTEQRVRLFLNRPIVILNLPFPFSIACLPPKVTLKSSGATE